MRVLLLGEELPWRWSQAPSPCLTWGLPLRPGQGRAASKGGRALPLLGCPHRRARPTPEALSPLGAPCPRPTALRRCQTNKQEVPGCPEALPHSHPLGGTLRPPPSAPSAISRLSLLLKGWGLPTEPSLRKGRGWGNFPGLGPCLLTLTI